MKWPDLHHLHHLHPFFGSFSITPSTWDLLKKWCNWCNWCIALGTRSGGSLLASWPECSTQPTAPLAGDRIDRAPALETEGSVRVVAQIRPEAAAIASRRASGRTNRSPVAV